MVKPFWRKLDQFSMRSRRPPKGAEGLAQIIRMAPAQPTIEPAATRSQKALA
jgi:hypothetical protein